MRFLGFLPFFFIAIAVAACFFILADFGGRPLMEPYVPFPIGIISFLS